MTHCGHDATNALDNPLWRYAIEQYKQESCAQFLLKAQDEHALNINILLFIGWLATQQHYLHMQALQTSPVFPWQKEVVERIRKIRKRVKKFQTVEFYQKILELELNAEQIQLGQLYSLTNSMIGNEEGFTQNVRGSCEVYFTKLNLKLEESWLQMLTEHLQPKQHY